MRTANTGADGGDILTWHEVYDGVDHGGTSCYRQMGQTERGQRSERLAPPTQMPTQTQHTSVQNEIHTKHQVRREDWAVSLLFFEL